MTHDTTYYDNKLQLVVILSCISFSVLAGSQERYIYIHCTKFRKLDVCGNLAFSNSVTCLANKCLSDEFLAS